MPGNRKEYMGSSVNVDGCPYSTLGSYHGGYTSSGAPVLAQISSSEVVVVPDYGGVPHAKPSFMERPTYGGYLRSSDAYAGCNRY